MLLVDGEMVLYYVETNNDGQSYLTRFASTDGVDWGAPAGRADHPQLRHVAGGGPRRDELTMWYLQSPAGCTSSYQDI